MMLFFFLCLECCFAGFSFLKVEEEIQKLLRLVNMIEDLCIFAVFLALNLEIFSRKNLNASHLSGTQEPIHLREET